MKELNLLNQSENTANLSNLPKRAEIPGHPFHMVELSPWPIVISVALFFIATNAVGYFYHIHYSGYGLLLSFISVLLIAYLWFRDINNEGTLGGYHTFAVRKSLTIGFALFVVSEIFVFVSVFWAYLHSGLSPAVEIGSIWPPIGVEAINPFEVPLLNTVLLLSSAGSLTYSHHALINNNRKGAIIGIILTLIIAAIFTGCQYIEYIDAPFTISDGVYGSVFYSSTGLHGLHIIGASTFLFVMLVRIINYSFTSHHHVGLESAAVYYHIVDVVWLFLWLIMYYWGS